MSEERSGGGGGGWGGAAPREETVWWPDHHHTHTHTAQHQQQHQFLEHHHQHHSAAVAAAQQQHLAAAAAAAAVAHQQEALRNSAAHHLFGYKMPPSAISASPGVSSYVPHGQPPPSQWWHYSNPPDNPLPDVQIPSAPQPPLNRGKMPKVTKSGSETKPRGRVTAYAFFLQICREEHKKKHPEENVVFAEFSKKCAERWKTMSEKEKKRFHEMADKDKKRYETEMKDYTPSENDKSKRGKKRKQIKDPNAPKRSLSAFFCFCSDERGKVKEANPEYSVGEIAKELGRRWSDADPAIKSKYEEMADKDKARYDREMTEYKKKGKFSSPPPPVETKKVGSEEDDDDEDDEEDE